MNRSRKVRTSAPGHARRRRPQRLIAGSAALLALTPAVALAGSTVFAGTQSLQVKHR